MSETEKISYLFRLETLGYIFQTRSEDLGLNIDQLSENSNIDQDVWEEILEGKADAETISIHLPEIFKNLEYDADRQIKLINAFPFLIDNS